MRQRVQRLAKPCWVEKLAAQAARVVTARVHQRFSMEAMPSRLTPAVEIARERVMSGELGPARLVLGNFVRPAELNKHGRLFDRTLAGAALLAGLGWSRCPSSCSVRRKAMHGMAVMSASVSMSAVRITWPTPTAHRQTWPQVLARKPAMTLVFTESAAPFALSRLFIDRTALNFAQHAHLHRSAASKHRSYENCGA